MNALAAKSTSPHPLLLSDSRRCGGAGFSTLRSRAAFSRPVPSQSDSRLIARAEKTKGLPNEKKSSTDFESLPVEKLRELATKLQIKGDIKKMRKQQLVDALVTKERWG
ncbi:hypothetical protein WJX73_006318 [Symbiochloris irregularis]|uniref:Rho termination factor-like N-terminal domain-containing protein n=1 Tax=Symbiochloris irregularis TaxID=706552 RepID=A0AAW1PRB9_9CHLO